MPGGFAPCASLRAVSPGRKGPKIVFTCRRCGRATVKRLVARRSEIRESREGDNFSLHDGKDPDGNPIQFSNH